MDGDVRYGLTRLWCGPSGLSLETSEPGLIDWLSAETKRLFPECKTKVLAGLSDEPYLWTVEKLAGQDFKLASWARAQMCHQGWEPFQADNNTIYLRKRL